MKEEYLDHYDLRNITEAKILLDQVIKLYNEDRPHMSIGNLVPSLVHQNQTIKIEKNGKIITKENKL
ncbi:MAG: integrase core domain-containing protein [Chitinophagales bacterium]